MKVCVEASEVVMIVVLLLPSPCLLPSQVSKSAIPGQDRRHDEELSKPHEL